ncbi:MAG: histidinol dehydrogenase [Eubacterium sp.]|nr:histidinol dehydrogenase [Eubacterium sp.]
MIKIYKYGEVDKNEILSRTKMPTGVEDIVAGIIQDVRDNGDKALLEYNRKFDHNESEDLEVSAEEIQAAYDQADPELISVMEEAAANIRDFHSRQKRNSFIISEKDGIVLGQKVMPIQRAGVYVPGGTAAYPSTVLMDCIPAKIAGCEDIIITTPATGGAINPVILAAAKIAGVTRIFRVGGAQAVAALAYGTETIPKVDKIVGPGNAFVAEAKKQVFGEVAIDMVAGPSEILVIADGSCDPVVVAADMLSQAEHDKFATAVLVTDSSVLAHSVAEELEDQLSLLPREEIARASIENNGKIIIADDLLEVIEVANEIAPEHLELCVDEPFAYLDKIRNAGSIFLGKNCPEALGDYFAGPNHTLPTSGTARFYSALSVDDFTKRSQYSYYTAEALDKVADKIARFAEEEGLQGHAKSVLIRREQKQKDGKAGADVIWH